jgi:Flp pilus assembly protein CpaB
VPICRNGLIGIQFVLLAITTTGWIVTATRDRAATPTTEPTITPARAPETVEMFVAAKDLPARTLLTSENLKDDQVVKIRRWPKDGLPPAFVTNREDLVGKWLTRPVGAGEALDPRELSKIITLPDGYDMVSLQVNIPLTVGWVEPGNRVNILATLRMGSKLYAFPLLVDVLVLAVDTLTSYDWKGLPSPTMVSFAVTEKQALVLALAKNRGCTLELMLRHPSRGAETDKDYDIDKLIKLLNDERVVGVDIARGVPVVEPIESAPPPRPVGESR